MYDTIVTDHLINKNQSATLEDQSTHFYMKQLVWMGISFAVAVVVLLVDASIYHKWAYLFYVLGLLTLVAALLFGREVNGAKAWFEIGSVRIQPVEFAKIATISFICGKTYNIIKIPVIIDITTVKTGTWSFNAIIRIAEIIPNKAILYISII